MIVGVVVTALSSVPRVEAGIVASDTPAWPSSVAVSTTFSASVVIVNQSTPGNDTESVLLTALFVTPACADNSSPLCLSGNRDPGVFDILSAMGDASSAPCAATAFSVGAADVATGEVKLTPTSTITLGPATGPVSSRTCQINLSLRVNKLPTNPAGGVTGRTDPLTHVALHGVTSGVDGSAATQPNPGSGTVLETPLNDVATLQGGNSPVGTITFNLFAPDDPTCSSSIFTNVVPVNGNGSYGTSTAFPAASVTQPGTYQWTARYGEDCCNIAVSSVCGDAPVAIRAAAAPVPSLSEWGIVALLALLIAVGSLRLRRRTT
jgi:hypothetical protein